MGMRSQQPKQVIHYLRVLRHRAEIPIYSFESHQRQEETTSIYSPHVLILEGIFALYDQRVLNLLDVKIFADADSDVCLARRSMYTILDSVVALWLMLKSRKSPGMSRIEDEILKVA